MEHLIPIDIKDIKLLDWLVDRNIVNRLWNEECKELRELLKQVEEEESPLVDIREQITPPIHYFTSVKVLEQLEKSPFGSKNLIGQHVHEYTAKWARIVKLFEKDSTYLADSAKSVIQNVKYDIPLLKKQISRSTQTKQDSIKKQSECNNNIGKYQQKYREKCADIGITGDHVRSELLNLVNNIPDHMSDIALCLPDIQPALNYYQIFAKFLINNPELDVCPVLHFVLKYGNVTVARWEQGGVFIESDTDSSVEIIEPIETRDKNGCVYVSTDLGMKEETTFSDNKDNSSPDIIIDNNDNIDFGIDTIDFGADIDFGEETVDYGEIDFGNDIEISVLEAGEEKQNELLLDNTNMRNKIIDELYELSAFLSARRDELAKHAESILSEIPECPTAVQTTQLCNVEEMSGTVNNILDKLTSDKMRHLLLLKNSEKYLDRLADSMHAQLRLKDKMESCIDDMNVRIAEAERTYEEVEPKLKIMIETTKLLKTNIETELSKRFKGRPVRIMGDINTL